MSTTHCGGFTFFGNPQSDLKPNSIKYRFATLSTTHPWRHTQGRPKRKPIRQSTTSDKRIIKMHTLNGWASSEPCPTLESTKGTFEFSD